MTTEHELPPPLKVEWRDESELSYDMENARLHDDDQLEAIKASLERFGQQRAIIVDKNNVVRCGNGTLQGIRALGRKWVKCEVTDLEGMEALAYALADNRIAEKARWDFELLTGHMRALKEALGDAILPTIGWKPFESDPLLAADFQPPPQSPLPTDNPDDVQFATIKVTKAQHEVIMRAMKAAEAEAESELSDGRALELICADYLAGHGDE